MNIDGRDLVHVQSDSLLQILLEILRLYLQLVVPDGQLKKHIVSLPVGGGTSNQSSFDLHRVHCCRSYRRSVWVDNRSANCPSNLLSRTKAAHKDCKQQTGQDPTRT